MRRSSGIDERDQFLPRRVVALAQLRDERRHRVRWLPVTSVAEPLKRPPQASISDRLRLTSSGGRSEDPPMSRTPDRHRRLRAVFDEALLQEPVRARGLRARRLRERSRSRARSHATAGSPRGHALVSRSSAELLRSAVRAEEHFAGTSRFRVLRRLGAGGMGAVYEVHDRDPRRGRRTEDVPAHGCADLYRLKREFRSLADVAHPNLVCLYELFVEDERCFFTMELVRGRELRRLRARRRSRPVDSTTDSIPALRQLVDGVSALHARGKLHRDIKPSNVLVTAGRARRHPRLRPDRRAAAAARGRGQLRERRHAGVHGAGGSLGWRSPSEAGDWYGVGVTLYEALTGTLPFAGTLTELLVSQDERSIRRLPRTWCRTFRPDLSAICMGLLCRDPAQRLSGPAALRAPGSRHRRR